MGDWYYSRTEEEKNNNQAAFDFAFLPKNVEYYIIIVKGENKVRDTFLGGMKLARYECAFDKSGKLIINENLRVRKSKK